MQMYGNSQADEVVVARRSDGGSRWCGRSNGRATAAHLLSDSRRASSGCSVVLAWSRLLRQDSSLGVTREILAYGDGVGERRRRKKWCYRRRQSKLEGDRAQSIKGK